MMFRGDGRGQVGADFWVREGRGVAASLRAGVGVAVGKAGEARPPWRGGVARFGHGLGGAEGEIPSARVGL